MNAERPQPTPEGKLLASAQQQTQHSQREAAELAGMSENHWRAITKGYRTVSAGVTAPVRAPAATIARMAQVVGVTPEQLEEADREDAAAELREMHSPEPAEQPRKDPEQMIAEGMALIAEAQEIRRRQREAS